MSPTQHVASEVFSIGDLLQSWLARRVHRHLLSRWGALLPTPLPWGISLSVGQGPRLHFVQLTPRVGDLGLCWLAAAALDPRTQAVLAGRGVTLSRRDCSWRVEYFLSAVASSSPLSHLNQGKVFNLKTNQDSPDVGMRVLLPTASQLTLF